VRVPLVPVTVTVNVPVVVPVHESVEVWDAPRTMLVGLKVHVNPAGDTVDDRATVPVNPLTGATVIVDVPEPPEANEKLVGLAVIVKSVIVPVTVAEWDRVPLVPVTVTVYVPAGPEHDKVEVCEAPRTTLVGLRVQVKPAGETVDVSATVPVKPFTGVTVMVDVAVAPANALTAVGLAVTV
jgi:hypothetical protein